MIGPGLFSNIGKRAKDLLTKGYIRDQKLTISTVTASGLVLTSASIKKKELYTHDISSVYKHKNTVINVIMGAESNISTTLTVLEALPFTNLLIFVELPDNKGGKLELHYCHFHKNASFATVIGMKPYPVLKISGTVGAPGVALGAEVQYDTARGEFTKYNAAVGVTKQGCHAAFILSNKGDWIKVSGLYHFDEKHRASVAAEFTKDLSRSKNTLTVGGKYRIDRRTKVNARLTSSGRLSALLVHKIKPKSLLTISGEFNTKDLDKCPKIGLAFCYSPRPHGSSRSSKFRHHAPEPAPLVPEVIYRSLLVS